ncbi:MAG: hypothetical protein HQ564_06145 [Candidatus Saganbacteria bacterium]|nr:hypothetical protein [Candidatus Saganbacteria bacterium]
MVISGINLAIKGYSLYKQVKSKQTQESKQETAKGKKPKPTGNNTSGIFDKAAELFSTLIESKEKKANPKTPTKIEIQKPQEKKPVTRSSYVNSLLERALENPNQPQYSMHLVVTPKGIYLDFDDSKVAKRQVRNMARAIKKYGRHFFRKSQYKSIAGIINQLYNVKSHDDYVDFLSNISKEETKLLDIMEEISDTYYQQALDQISRLKADGYKAGRIKIKIRGKGKLQTTQYLTKTVLPKDLTGELKAAYDRLPNEKKAKIDKLGIKVTIKVSYFNSTTPGYLTSFKSVAKGKHAAVVYMGHSFTKLPKKLIRHAFRNKNRNPKHPTLFLPLHCNSLPVAKYLNKQHKGLYIPGGTTRSVFPTGQVFGHVAKSLGVPDFSQINTLIAKAIGVKKAWGPTETKKAKPVLVASVRQGE